MMSDQSPVITRPSDPSELEKLKAKQSDYASRVQKRMFEDYRAPELIPEWYALRIITEVIEKGSVETWELCRAIAKEQGGTIVRLDAFEGYCNVINDYCTNGVRPLPKRHRDGSIW